MRSYESIFVDDYLTRSIFDLHSDTFMAILEQRDGLFDDTPLQKSREWDRKRQAAINRNVVEALNNETFKRAVVIYGISHRPFIVRAIQKSNAARVLRLHEAMKPKVPSYFERKKSIFLE